MKIYDRTNVGALMGGCVLLLFGSLEAQSTVLTFEPGDPNNQFVFDQFGAYQPNPYDSPDDGADHLAQQTASEWVGLKSGETAAGSLYWDGGLDGGNNSLTNLLLPDTFKLDSFMIVGVYGSQTLSVRGINNGQLIYSQELAVDLTPRLFLAGWVGIDTLEILSGADFVADPAHADGGVRRNWAIDNLVYNETTAVPLPGAGLLFALGGLPLITLLKRRAPASGRS